MDHLFVRTSVANFGFIGRLHADRPRPALLAINGTFPPKDYLHDLPDAFPGVNVLMVQIPGMVGTPWSSRTPAELTAGLQEAIRALLRDLPLVVLSASTGNLLSLGLRDPNIRHRICVEPFFQTESLWPFIAYARQVLATYPGDANIARYLWDFFGVAPDRLENRDYRGLMEGVSTPTDVLTGTSLLLPERECLEWPSFTMAEDREGLAANPLVRMHAPFPDTGHNVGQRDPGAAFVRQLAHAALREAAKLYA